MRLKEVIAMLTEFSKVAGDDAECQIVGIQLEGSVSIYREPSYSYAYPSSHKEERRQRFDVVFQPIPAASPAGIYTAGDSPETPSYGSRP